MKIVIPSMCALMMFSATVSAESKIQIVSDPGDYIGQGQMYSYDDTNASITYSRNYDNGITVRISSLPGDTSFWWTLDIAAPGNDEIDLGQYLGAQRFPFQDIDKPGLSFTGQGRGCNSLTGSFEVFEVVYESDGSVKGLNISFEQHCEGAAAALKGKVEFNVVPPVGASAVGLTPNVVECRNNTTKQRVRKSTSEPVIDCKKLGLAINPGDEIQLRVIGEATQ
ncbi:hypothetical protein [Pseudoalteromonas sp. GB56]